jgi:DNA-binding beta-propeller fold protein YncE
VNNDGTIQNPRGETDAIPAIDITSLAAGSTVNVFSLPNVGRFPLGPCDPTGLDLGPGTDMIVVCRQGNKGEALTALITNRTNGAILATLPAGGGDQVWYDARTNKYYIGASRWHTSGKNDLGGGCSATNACDPRLFIVDAATRQVVRSIPVGNNAHSVAVDPLTGDVFVPYSSATSPAGCPGCAANGFTDGGIAIFQPFS